MPPAAVLPTFTALAASFSAYACMVDPDAAARTLGLLAAFRFDAWRARPEWAVFTVAVLLGYSAITALTQSAYLFGRCGARLEVRAKRLEDPELRWTDYAFVTCNKLVTVAYVVYAATSIRQAEWVAWEAAREWSPWAHAAGCLATVLLALGCYDLIYVPFHRLLHVPALYPYVHKHHHRQAVPFRGTFDGINTHPLEFAFGEFLHVWALHVAGGFATQVLGVRLPAWGALAFLVTGGLMASLNHTRFGIRIPFVYDVRTHDVHHRKPRSNYCQFVPWFDMLYGSFEEYRTKEEARQERLEARKARTAGKKGATLLDSRSLGEFDGDNAERQTRSKES
jgi:sterol desaturase/sphingolipid hydroxylase (fatty acid hydroxylase superfamily)